MPGDCWCHASWFKAATRFKRRVVRSVARCYRASCLPAVRPEAMELPPLLCISKTNNVKIYTASLKIGGPCVLRCERGGGRASTGLQSRLKTSCTVFGAPVAHQELISGVCLHSSAFDSSFKIKASASHVVQLLHGAAAYRATINAFLNLFPLYIVFNIYIYTQLWKYSHAILKLSFFIIFKATLCRNLGRCVAPCNTTVINTWTIKIQILKVLFNVEKLL